MNPELYTQAKATGYKVQLDIFDNVFKAYTPQGVLICQHREDETNSNTMWQYCIEHMLETTNDKA